MKKVKRKNEKMKKCRKMKNEKKRGPSLLSAIAEVTVTSSSHAFADSESANSDDMWPLRVVTSRDGQQLVQVQHGGGTQN